MRDYQFRPRYTCLTVDLDGYVNELEWNSFHDLTPLDAKVTAMEQWEKIVADQGTVYLHAFFYVEPQPGYDRGRHLISSF